MDRLVKAPRTEKGRETVNRILSAAAEVFYEKGYHGSNVNTIAQRAGIATGTFYIYFEGKYNLYKCLLLQCSHQIRSHLAASTKHCQTRKQAEREGLKAWLEFILQNQYMYNIIWESLYVDRSLFLDYYETFHRAYARGLNSAKEQGEVRGIDTEVLAYTLMGAASFLGLNWGVFKQSGGGPGLDYVVDEFMKLLEGGMFAGQPLLSLQSPLAQSAGNKDVRFHVELDEDFWYSLDGGHST